MASLYFTAQQAKDIVTVLKKCRKYLWNGVYPMRGRSVFICYALGDVVGTPRGWRWRDSAYHAKSVIMGRLNGAGNLGNWLRTYGKVPANRVSNEKLLQRHRLQWVGLLIAEFQALSKAGGGYVDV